MAAMASLSPVPLTVASTPVRPSGANFRTAPATSPVELLTASSAPAAFASATPSSAEATAITRALKRLASCIAAWPTLPTPKISKESSALDFQSVVHSTESGRDPEYCQGRGSLDRRQAFRSYIGVMLKHFNLTLVIHWLEYIGVVLKGWNTLGSLEYIGVVLKHFNICRCRGTSIVHCAIQHISSPQAGRRESPRPIHISTYARQQTWRFFSRHV